MLIEDIGLRLKDNNYILELQKKITDIEKIVIYQPILLEELVNKV
ncbi:MAG: hypothetical protein ACXWEW_10180 [Nitrososphaeraceae archaeon]